MKKGIAVLIMFALCLGLCACGGSAESVELPTKPVVSENQPANTASGEAGETTESTEDKYPWEIEFREEDYFPLKITAPNGEKITSYRIGGIFGMEVRYYCEYPNGDICDEYYYPSGNKSHSYTWGADGSYSESYYLDNGYTDPEKQIIYMGTVVYEKNIEADGTESELVCDENGNLTFSAHKEANGTYSEYYYFENGNMSKSFYDNPNTGEHEEGEYFENGNIKRYVLDNSSTGESSHQEYFENGNFKYNKNQSPEYTQEERYDEEGFHTYWYSKDANYEIELIADETGKLIRFVENGTVYENEAIPDWVAGSYNFRG